MPVVALPVWIESWVYECCGAARRAGESVVLALTFAGDVAETTEPDQVDVLPEGKVRLVGSVVGQVRDEGDDDSGTLVQSGNVQIAISGPAPATRISCTGQLWEIRHGFPAGKTRGRLFDIRWRPAVLREVGPRSSAVDGYGEPTELSSTDDWPREGSDSWALELMERMGHSTTRAALTYLHPSDERQRVIADAMSKIGAGELKRRGSLRSGTPRARKGRTAS